MFKKLHFFERSASLNYQVDGDYLLDKELDHLYYLNCSSHIMNILPFCTLEEKFLALALCGSVIAIITMMMKGTSFEEKQSLVMVKILEEKQ